MTRTTWTCILALVVSGCTRLPIGPEPADSVERVGAPSSDPPPGVGPAEPTDAALFQQSYDEEAAGHLETALAALDRVRPAGSSEYVATLRRGWLLYRLGKSEDAVVAYGKAAALAPDAVEARLGALAPLAALRRWNDVEVAARDVLAKDPSSYAASLRLAFALYSQARFADAEAVYRRLARLYPSDVDVRDGLGWSLLKLGKARDAAAEFAAVLAIAPQNALAREGAHAAGGHT